MEARFLLGADGTAAMHGRCVLIADDDLYYLEILNAAFARQGLGTLCVRDGQQAWRLIHTHSALSVVVLNWMLPGLDGHRIARRVVRLNRPVTVIQMIGQGVLSDVCAQMDIQADRLLPKPFNAEQANDRIARICRELRGACGAPAPAAGPRPSPADPRQLARDRTA